MKAKFLVIVMLAIATFALVGKSVLAASGTTSKAGWGYGDTNHTHVGPPGQSVRPNK